MEKKKMISGIKPTGKLTLGNYIGAIKPFVSYQDDYDLMVFVADLHALTLPIKPEDLRQNTEDLVAIYLASGLNPEKVTIFKQSQILEHTQLEWILTCNTNLGELTKMPQYKNFLDKNGNKAVPTGMLMYPSLMNADILLYDADVVPVGIDQKPHVDLTRDVALKFNQTYPNTFKLPEAVIAKTGAKIRSLSDPTKKMSKSESDKGTIYLLDDLEVTKKKIMKATTDSEGKIYFDPEHKPGISNLLTIYSALTNRSVDDIVEQYKDFSNYGIFKKDLADIVCNELNILQTKVEDIKDSNLIYRVLSEGREYAETQAHLKLVNVKKKIGLI